MKMVFVADGNLHRYTKDSNMEDADVVLFDFTALNDIDYKSELNGEMHKLEEFAIHSKRQGKVLLAGCYTNSHGMVRKSVVVADNGKILGVADMIHTEEESDYIGGAHIKVYDTHAGKIGVLVADDILYPHLAETLALCDADYIVCIYEELVDNLPTVMLRAAAFASGVHIVMRAAGVVQIASASGEIIYRTAKKLDSFELDLKREYRLRTRRGRGYGRKEVKDY